MLAPGFGLMTPIGWEWALGMWAYALSWFVFNDVVKMTVLHYYRKHKANVMILSDSRTNDRTFDVTCSERHAHYDR